ncbi:dual specificity protein phosphatase Mpk3-like [Armigeres subalbatus]|uniref:dual specificity protein phosphatase Mpk3-like n=1 Tax=Armigeres subalbatus TaxID=124917 RepID=UPI002ED0412D
MAAVWCVLKVYFRQSFLEWCEDEVINADLRSGCAATEHLMGLRSLRISILFSDSACSSSSESSNCESSSNYLVEPVEIMTGIFLGNASHSEDLKSLKKYNIEPNVFERDGHIKCLQIPITDHCLQDLVGHFSNAIECINKARSKGVGVLVHCLAGVSRSVTITSSIGGSFPSYSGLRNYSKMPTDLNPLERFPVPARRINDINDDDDDDAADDMKQYEVPPLTGPPLPVRFAS